MSYSKSVIEEILMKGLLIKQQVELRKTARAVKDPRTSDSWKLLPHLGLMGQEVWICPETMDREGHQTAATA